MSDKEFFPASLNERQAGKVLHVISLGKGGKKYVRETETDGVVYCQHCGHDAKHKHHSRSKFLLVVVHSSLHRFYFSHTTTPPIDKFSERVHKTQTTILFCGLALLCLPQSRWAKGDILDSKQLIFPLFIAHPFSQYPRILTEKMK